MTIDEIIESMKEMLWFSQYNDSIGWNPYADTETLEAAIKELEASQPRLLSLEELREQCPTMVWYEENDLYGWRVTRAYGKAVLRDGDGDVIILWPGWDVEEEPDNTAYGRKWRCWTRQPSKEMRKAVPFDYFYFVKHGSLVAYKGGVKWDD